MIVFIYLFFYEDVWIHTCERTTDVMQISWAGLFYVVSEAARKVRKCSEQSCSKGGRKKGALFPELQKN